MIYNIIYTSRFKKDLKKIQKSGKSLDDFKEVVVNLINGKKIERRFKDHKLTGNYKSRRECHIAPDWLLVYKIEGDNIIFERTGSHSDLFR